MQPMPDALLPVILAGGSGTRLWPLSREHYPKQFLNLAGERTMLQQTLLRLEALAPAPPLLVCNHAHRFLVAEQCRRIGVKPAAILLEPAPRNTAPAVALAAFHACRDGADPLLLVLPADHLIGSAEAFAAAVRCAAPHAADGRLATFGIVPTGAETGYGYIRGGAALGDSVREVAAFVEKPVRAAAERYLADGGYFWNSGIFLFRASAYLAELEVFRPRMHRSCAAAAEQEHADLDFIRPGAAFADCPSESVDYAVMEHTDRAIVAAADMGWSDLGSWRAVAEALPRDADGNAARGDVIAVDTRNSLLRGGDRLLAALGLDGVVVVDTDDAVLVADRARAQDVKRIVEQLRAADRDEHRMHATVYRPWGSAQTFKRGPGFLVKRITVNPGESLSLQMHHHRAEHWVVICGTAEVVRGDECFVLEADASTYIPVGVRHRLANPGTAPLEIIEVQVGDYLSEDDIVRFEDRYGRAQE